jgi:TolB-like protein/DNA-binding winged helix-turn-helix (wHTH) protein
MPIEDAARRVRFGDFVVDLDVFELRKRGIRLKLQDQPFQILKLLLHRPGQLVTREELRTKLWPESTFVDFDAGLNAAIRRLRDTLNDSAAKPRYIETIPRHGYRFIAGMKPLSEEQIDISEAAVMLVSKQTRSAYLKGPISREEDAQAVVRRPSRYLLLALGAAVLVLATVTLISGFWRRALFVSHASTEIHSIAVLPLQILSRDSAQDYFADGMTEALITDLARISSLRVISRNSTMRYKDTKKSIPEIARELNVDAVIAGSIIQDGTRVRVSAQLLQAFPERHLWAQSYDREIQDVLFLQDQVAKDVAAQVQATIATRESQTLRSTRTLNRDAYEDYLKGLYFFNRQDPTNLHKAIDQFQMAIQKDKTFAPAYGHLAECYLVLSLIGEMSPSEAYERAEETAYKALTLDENSESGHSVLAAILLSRDGNWPKAEAEFQRAILSNPGAPLPHIGYARLLMILKKSKEANEQEAFARALDPLSYDVLLTVVVHSYFRREYEKAFELARTAEELYPTSPGVHVLLSNIYLQQNKSSLAGEEILLAEKLFGAGTDRISALRVAFQSAGILALVRKRVEMNLMLVDSQPSIAYDLANDYCLLSEPQQALDWLEKARAAREPKILLIGLEPHFDILRSDPRFEELKNNLSLP